MSDAVIQTAIWAGVVLILGGGFLIGFRGPISSFIGRATKISANRDGATIEAAGAEQKQIEATGRNELQVLPSPETRGGPNQSFPDPSPLYDPIDTDFRQRLEKAFGAENWELKNAWAVRVNSHNFVERVHETNYRLIFTSQISALKSLNELVRVPLSRGHELYNASAEQNPEFFKLVTWESWSAFLKNTGYVAFGPEADPIITLTPMGKDFLVWMVARGVPERKAY